MIAMRGRAVASNVARFACTTLACLALAGCFRLGPVRLSEDQIGYARALTDSQKQQTLLDIVQLRYGDTPTFLDATQVISGYQLQKNVTGGFEAFPVATPGTYLTGSGSLQLQESPTFTFQPVAGEQFAESFIRPIPPDTLLPLAYSGLPIDVLFRLAVQSVNGLDNSSSLTRSANQGSPGFFALVRNLRVLQIAGLLGVREVGAAPSAAPSATTSAAPSATTSAAPHDGLRHGAPGTDLVLQSSSDPGLQAVVVQTRRLLGLAPDEALASVSYGRTPLGPGRVAILTRPILGVLASIAFNFDVPPRDVAEGRTIATPPLDAYATRRPIAVHWANAAPADAFVSVEYHHRWFWVSDTDFDSKIAFALLQVLLQLAKTDSAPGTVITIPAG